MDLVIDVASWGHTKAAGAEALRAFTLALSVVNRGIIQSLGLPRLYDAGIFYREVDPDGYILLEDALCIYGKHFSDCKNLVAWRKAEFDISGKPSDVIVDWTPGPRMNTIYHVYLKTQDGIEDPSRILGM